MRAMDNLLESIKHHQYLLSEVFLHYDKKILWYLVLLLLTFLVTKSKLRALVGVMGMFLSFELLCSCFPLTSSTPMALSLAAGLSFATLSWTFMPLFYSE